MMSATEKHSCIAFCNAGALLDPRFNYNYVEIGDIDVGTGSAFANTVATEELPDNAKIMTQKGDLLVSTVRPNRGAVAILGNGDLLVSGAFTVLREDGCFSSVFLPDFFPSQS